MIDGVRVQSANPPTGERDGSGGVAGADAVKGASISTLDGALKGGAGSGSPPREGVVGRWSWPNWMLERLG